MMLLMLLICQHVETATLKHARHDMLLQTGLGSWLAQEEQGLTWKLLVATDMKLKAVRADRRAAAKAVCCSGEKGRAPAPSRCQVTSVLRTMESGAEGAYSATQHSSLTLDTAGFRLT